jgi:hypothetical protein
VRSVGIDTKKTITLKSLDGYEKEMPVRVGTKYHYQAKRYSLSKGWMDFARSTNISVGDKCVFKFITSEDKLCLAKITQVRPTQVDDDDDDVEVDNGMDDKDVDKDVELVDGVDDGDPFFQTRLLSPAKVVKRKRGRSAKVVKRKRGRPAKIMMAENVKITAAEVVKGKRGRPPASPRATEDAKRKKKWEPHGHSGDVEGVDPRVSRPAKRLCGKVPQQKW